MARILLEVVLPFLLPFLAFGLWRLLVTRGRGLLERMPWFALTAAGLLMACGSLASTAFMGGDLPGVYVPSHLDHGRLVPAQVRPR